MTPEERRVLERAVQRVTDQATNPNAIVDEAMDAGLDGSEPFVVNLKMLRAELLSVKGDLERELERVVLDCVVCGVPAHYVGGLGVRAGLGHTPLPRRTRRRSWRGETRSSVGGASRTDQPSGRQA
jgi:hypothetical protein